MRTPWERECSAIFGCIVHWHGEWRNRKSNLTAPDKGSAFLLRPTYINLLLLLLCWLYIYLYTCLRWYQRAEVGFWDIQVHLCVSWKFLRMSPKCGLKKNLSVRRFHHMLKRTVVEQNSTWPILFPLCKQLLRPPSEMPKVAIPAAHLSHVTVQSLSAVFVGFSN